MTFRIISTAIFLVSLFSHCAQTQMLPKNFEGQQIEFGSAGGFAGTVNSYSLLENGKLYKNNAFTDSSTFLIDVDIDLVQQIFSNYDVLNLSSIDINEPGNLYKFVTYKSEGQEHKMVWTGKSEDKNLNLFYGILNSTMSDKLDSK